ncbi:hypothetical protein [Falsiroseomonas sp. E2-1-a20]|uniref:hypothetical protein n=1 Tax=Falsiroseomonas sp. E2-1-a20 TaxID=3239300 RepID=UPI003F3F8CD3
MNRRSWPAASLLVLLATAAWNGAAAQVAAPVDGRPVVAETSQDLVRTLMQTRGYSEIGEMRRDGDVYIVSEARRFGEAVRDLRVEVLSGQVQAEQPLSTEQVGRLLESRGYTRVSELGRDDEAIITQAHQNDRAWQLRIDARRGTLLHQQPVD